MNLFQLINHQVHIQPEAYVLEPFAVIWDRDKSKDKSRALAELAFIYFMTDYKSDFNAIVDKNERQKEISKYLRLGSDFDLDDKLRDAMMFYEIRQKTITMYLLEDVYKSIDKLREYFREVDLMLMDDNGKPVYDVTKLTRSIESVAKIVDSLKILEDKVKREMEESGLRAGRKKGMFEDAE